MNATRTASLDPFPPGRVAVVGASKVLKSARQRGQDDDLRRLLSVFRIVD